VRALLAAAPVKPGDYPMELRSYPKGASMDWYAPSLTQCSLSTSRGWYKRLGVSRRANSPSWVLRLGYHQLSQRSLPSLNSQ
jgi:hypothetical protein